MNVRLSKLKLTVPMALASVIGLTGTAFGQGVKAAVPTVRAGIPQTRALSSGGSTYTGVGGGSYFGGGGIGGGVICKRHGRHYVYPPYAGPRYGRKYDRHYGDSCDLDPWYRWGYHGLYGFHPYGYWYTNSSYDGPAMYELVRRVDPALIYPEGEDGLIIPEPPDPAYEALYEGEYDLAANLFAERALEQIRSEKRAAQQDQAADDSDESSPPIVVDRSDLRLTALALVGAGRMDKAASMCLAAYEQEPGLALSPLDGAMLVNGASEMRKLVTRAVRYANETPSYENWFLVAVLMQGEGRDDMARRMLDRASQYRANSARIDATTTPSNAQAMNR